MTRILLTGGGFSRNWGGWLANEAFEYLLGCSEIDEETRKLVWRSKESGGGFEGTLADLASATDNERIGDAVEKGLKLFIIGPRGVDVLDKRQKEPVGRARDEYMDKLAPNIIGASRRPLTSIFNDDVVEHGRVMKFFV